MAPFFHYHDILIQISIICFLRDRFSLFFFFTIAIKDTIRLYNNYKNLKQKRIGGLNECLRCEQIFLHAPFMEFSF